MKLVVDTNVLFTYFWEQSAFKSILDKDWFYCISPEFALAEMGKYKETIKEKANLDEKTFCALREELALYVEFIPVEEYAGALAKAVNISPDPNDCDFFALAITQKSRIWSNDSLLKSQPIVPVLNIQDILELAKQLTDE